MGKGKFWKNYLCDTDRFTHWVPISQKNIGVASTTYPVYLRCRKSPLILNSYVTQPKLGTRKFLRKQRQLVSYWSHHPSNEDRSIKKCGCQHHIPKARIASFTYNRTVTECLYKQSTFMFSPRPLTGNTFELIPRTSWTGRQASDCTNSAGFTDRNSL